MVNSGRLMDGSEACCAIAYGIGVDCRREIGIIIGFYPAIYNRVYAVNYSESFQAPVVSFITRH